MCKILGGVETGGVSVPPSKGSIEILVYKGGVSLLIRRIWINTKKCEKNSKNLMKKSRKK